MQNRIVVVLALVHVASVSVVADNIDEILWMTEPVEAIERRIASDDSFVSARAENGMTALMFASRDSPYVEVITLLIESGSKIDARDRQGRTALMHAAAANFLIDLEPNRGGRAINALLDAGSEINARDASGETALMHAAQHNPNGEDEVEALIERGSDIDAVDRYGRTALVLAVISAARFADSSWHDADYNEAVVMALLNAGADATVQDRYGKTAWDYIESSDESMGTDFYWMLNDRQF